MSHVSLLFHIIFRTKYSEQTICEQYEKKLYSYINGIIKNKKGVLYAIGGKPDHIHILLFISPTVSISDFMKILKTETSKWLKESPYFNRFSGWSSGYAIFSYSNKEKEILINYINNQKEHHKKHLLREEIELFLTRNGINFEMNSFFKDNYF